MRDAEWLQGHIAGRGTVWGFATVFNCSEIVPVLTATRKGKCNDYRL